MNRGHTEHLAGGPESFQGDSAIGFYPTFHGEIITPSSIAMGVLEQWETGAWNTAGWVMNRVDRHDCSIEPSQP